MRTALQSQLNADKQIISYIARKNMPFTTVEDAFMKELLVNKYGDAAIKSAEYYRTTGLDHVFASYKDTVVEKVNGKKIGVTSDLWSTLNSDVSILVLTGTIMREWSRDNFILAVKAMTSSHTAANICAKINEILADIKVEKSNIVFLSRDSGSNMVRASKLLGIKSLQCGNHCLNLIVKDSLKKADDPENKLGEQICHIVDRATKLAASFARSSTRRQSLAENQKRSNLPKMRIPKVIDIRWNSLFYCLDAIKKNKNALIGMVVSKETIYVTLEDFNIIDEFVKLLKPFADETLRVSCTLLLFSPLILPF